MADGMPNDSEEYMEGDGPCFRVVGGAESGGIIVRAGEDVKSDALARLEPGSEIETLMLKGGRLQYHLLTGKGPLSGWVSTKFKDKDLVVLCVRPRVEVPHA
mmetsp:Transcript_61059/g.175172  ORF Transcript_61059/g.175172 Transcript_61059/m.175172 type:complete len:102 (+) Transcript_61059:102-407(+)|eukprot:CAMPEP_0177151854 /NCGR_PEP_ID=MMETSP0367-20130122/183_1 /TAXON_ID=447022 ORGANISM="Scrippsiella hangoei-like, Strain SHHI-4" /NCGR_SAMPLE_ID=MMETSP0367 /ASSEMBLY_ACC=CAM_ASM_000362 /LENGTH=101 /DNA_ID=CAMNT_0018596805 /DNA_START=76 /DNA_END=381 /DNA_ORIENTATION=+